MATIYCPDGNPDIRLFRKIYSLSNRVMFLGDFNSKHKHFKPNQSDPMLVNIAKDLKLFYLNSLSPNSHTRENPAHGTSDILDMAFISPGLSSRDFSFSVSDDHMGSDHFPIQISVEKPPVPKRNTPLTELRYKLDRTDNKLFHKTLHDSLNTIGTDIDAQDELEDSRFIHLKYTAAMTLKHPLARPS